MNARSGPVESAPSVGGATDAATAQRPLGGGALVRREVLRRIYDGRYPPGRRLVEADLTREFQVSRSSVREGLGRLAAEGLVSHTPHRGALIRAVDCDELLEILDVFGSLSMLNARLAAEAYDPAKHGEALAEVRRQMVVPGASGENIFPRGRRLKCFLFMLDIGANRELRRMIRQVHLHAVVVKLLGRAHATVLEEYREVLDAVEARDPVAAEASARLNYERNRAYLRSLPPSDFGEPDKLEDDAYTAGGT
jgi:DNA-binding GntR family transcriptional regulator